MRRHLIFFGLLGVLLSFLAMASRENLKLRSPFIAVTPVSTSVAMESERELLLSDRTPASSRLEIEPVNGNE